MIRDRRVFLKTAAACAMACSSSKPTPASGPISAGNVKDVPVGTLKSLPNGPVILGRDDGGLYALTAICTHEQCDITESGAVNPKGDADIQCFCHGSRFDRNGSVLHGPATQPLDHFRVVVDATGAISVQAGQIVPATTRTKVS